MHSSIPTPPREDKERSKDSSRKSHSGSKLTKSVHRGSKRATPHSHSHSHSHSPSSPTGDHVSADGRHKRVWKACERCRMKKTKCDGEFPCKRCKDDGLVCTAGTRKKTEYKQLPKGYAEVLENTQFALIATVHKLYSMVRAQQPWELGEPDLNDRGQPVIHNIASKLGCIRPNADMDLPVHSVFPEDEAGLAELASQLEAQQEAQGHSFQADAMESRTDRASSSELDHSDFETDYRRAVFGSGNGSGNGALNMSPQSLAYNDFDVGSTASDGYAVPSPTTDQASGNRYPAWLETPVSVQTTQYLPATTSFMNVDLLNQGLLESSFGTLKPHVPSCPNPEVMMGMGDPMIYSGYGAESLRM